MRPLFDTQNEKEDTTQLSFQNKVKFLKQETLTGAAATAIVSTAGTISSIDITDGGVGYTTATVSIASTVGVGTTTQAMGSVTISGVGTVTGLVVEPLMMRKDGAKHGGRMQATGHAYIGKPDIVPNSDTTDDENDFTRVRLYKDKIKKEILK